jgi:predicted esterase/uncharacterized cupin superfamily protein
MKSCRGPFGWSKRLFSDNPGGLAPWVALLLLSALVSCVGSSDSPGQGSAEVRYCVEATTLDGRGDPRNAAGYIRYCWPGEPACFCDRDNDCYALDGYLTCVNPPDGGVDAGADSAADADATADRADADVADAALDRVDADVADARDADVADATLDRTDASDADVASDRVDADVAADRVDASDAAADRVDADVTDAAADRVDADVTDAAADRVDADVADVASDGARYCPEAVTPDFRGDPRNAAGYIRWCWPGEAACFCDRDSDCYRLSGYVACVPVGGTDAGADVAVDTSMDVAVDTSMDAAVDTSMDARLDTSMDVATDTSSDTAADTTPPPNYCPGATITGRDGQQYDPVTLGLRQCWPGERYCFCDTWNDCYRQSGYVPCVPSDGGTADAGTCDAAVDAPASDAGTLPVDPIAYTGTFSTAPGYHYASFTVAGIARDVWYYVPRRTCARPALVLAFHGATQTGTEIVQRMDAQHVAERNGFILVAPNARFMSAAQADFNRPAGNAIYWETQRNTDPNSNPDLMLTRAIIREAQRSLNTDPDRTYATGYSNGGFMSIEVAVTLHDRIAAWAITSSGMVPCMYRTDCGFRGTALSCGALQTQPGYCACTGPDKPIALPGTFRRPAYVSHAVQDTVVSVYYSCTLDQRLSALGVTHQMNLWNGDHYPRDGFLADAWSFMSRYTR